MGMIERAFAAALLLAFAWPAGALAASDDAIFSGEILEWPLPWRAGVELRYRTEGYDDVHDAQGRQRTRVTATATVRIAETGGDGYLQRWTISDSRLEGLEGALAGAAAMQATRDALGDIVLEVEVDRYGTDAGVRNLADISERMRPAMHAAQQGEDIAQFNRFVGVTTQEGLEYVAGDAFNHPDTGEALPAKIRFSSRAAEPGSDDVLLEWTTQLDLDQANASSPGPGTPRAAADGLSMTEAGWLRYRQSSGVIEMLEATLTQRLHGKLTVKRRRMRLLDGGHDHAWPDDGALTRDPRQPNPAAQPAPAH